MASYGQQYIGGRPWPSSIRITRPSTPEELARFKRSAAPAAPVAPVATPATGAGVPVADPTAPAKPTLSAEARLAWEKAIEQYRPGGGYGKGVEAGLERGRTKAVASGMQGLVSAGLAGTTMAGGLGKKFEEEVGMPARARVEETRAQAIASLKAALAGAEQRGYETAEERALRERLSASQLATQREIAGGQLGLGYAGLTSREKIAGGQLGLGYAGLTSREQMASITPAPATRPQQRSADTQDFYVKPGGGYSDGQSYGSIVGGEQEQVRVPPGSTGEAIERISGMREAEPGGQPPGTDFLKHLADRLQIGF